MLTNSSHRKLSLEILGLFFLSFLIAVFSYGFLYYTSCAILNSRLIARGVSLNDLHITIFYTWLRNLCLIASMVIFSALFFFFVGQKLIYIITIIRGVQQLREDGLEVQIPVEGNDELTELAESINKLSASILYHRQVEEQMQQEKDELIRGLSHDIKNPLTSVISYTQFLLEHPGLDRTQTDDYLHIIRDKSEQIRVLIGLLLSPAQQDTQFLPDGRLFLQQLLEEMEADLEDHFQLEIDTQQLPEFSAQMNVQDVQRIFENLSSNILKYADPAFPVQIQAQFDDQVLMIRQQNHILPPDSSRQVDSTRIGLRSIALLAHRYHGGIHTEEADGIFCITVRLMPNPPVTLESSTDLQNSSESSAENI